MAEEEKVKINAQEKLSYEQVLEVANGLQDQNQYLKNQCNQLAAKLREVSEFTAFKRLDYLFKVVELPVHSVLYRFSSDFVDSCVKEIESTITIASDGNEAKETKGE